MFFELQFVIQYSLALQFPPSKKDASTTCSVLPPRVHTSLLEFDEVNKMMRARAAAGSEAPGDAVPIAAAVHQPVEVCDFNMPGGDVPNLFFFPPK